EVHRGDFDSRSGIDRWADVLALLDHEGHERQPRTADEHGEKVDDTPGDRQPRALPPARVPGHDSADPAEERATRPTAKGPRPDTRNETGDQRTDALDQREETEHAERSARVCRRVIVALVASAPGQVVVVSGSALTTIIGVFVGHGRLSYGEGESDCRRWC